QRRGVLLLREPRRETREPVALVALGTRRRLRDELGAQARREPHVLGVDPAQEPFAPRREVVDPARDRVLPGPDAVDAEGAGPAIVAEELHRGFGPVVVVRAAPAKRARDLFMAMGETVGGDHDVLAGHALGREAPAIDARLDVLDHRGGGELLAELPARVVHASASGSNSIMPNGGSV